MPNIQTQPNNNILDHAFFQTILGIQATGTNFITQLVVDPQVAFCIILFFFIKLTANRFWKAIIISFEKKQNSLIG